VVERVDAHTQLGHVEDVGRIALDDLCVGDDVALVDAQQCVGRERLGASPKHSIKCKRGARLVRERRRTHDDLLFDRFDLSHGVCVRSFAGVKLV
jgi:hypothetical protein